MLCYYLVFKLYFHLLYWHWLWEWKGKVCLCCSLMGVNCCNKYIHYISDTSKQTPLRTKQLPMRSRYIVCCSAVPVEGIWQGGGVCQRTLLLTGKLLFHREGVIINNHWHHGRQEAGHHLQILRAGTRAVQRTSTTYSQFIEVHCNDSEKDSTLNHFHTDFSSETYQTRLFKDLAVDHVPRPLTQWQHPQQQHQVWTVLFTNTDTTTWHSVDTLVLDYSLLDLEFTHTVKTRTLKYCYCVWIFERVLAEGVYIYSLLQNQSWC